ncbi:hypothetical protein [Roseateles sp.]|uniref:hypothetical protein n=1 Tax=Roseateles sp. TaxID=1971397 RepID=UPI003BA79E2B
MFYALSWFAVLSLIALWSLTAWAFHALSQWGAANTDGLVGAAAPLQEILGPWLPPDLSQALAALLSSLQPIMESLLSLIPALAGGLSFMVWLVWGLGCILLLILGAVLHAVIALARRHTLAGKA